MNLSEIQGDSLSRLIQLRAKRFGITNIKWVGRAIEDLDALCLEYNTRKMLNECLWDNGLRLLMDMPEFKDAPEAVQAKIAAIILQAKAQFELKVNERTALLARTP